MKFCYTIFLFSFFLSGHLLAACGYSLSAPALNYSVSSINPTTPYSLSLSRSNSSGSSCKSFTMGFSKGGSNSYLRVATNASTGASISYNLYQANNSISSLKLLMNASSVQEILSGSVSKNSTTTLNYYFTLGTLNNASLTRGGIYQDTVRIEANAGTFSNDRGLETSQLLSININVPKVASLSLVDTGLPYNSTSTNKTLDFGELSTSEEMSFDIIVLSNAGYNLSISSSNNEVLQLSGASANPNTKIAYDFYSNGVQKNLTSSASTPVTLSSGSGVTSVQGTRIPIRVVIQSVSDKVAGTYQDYVTFTIATTE